MRSRAWRSWAWPSPALVISVLALMVALGGTGYAAFSLPPGSVGTKQLKDGAVTSRKVRFHTLLSSDFASGQLPRGPRGAPGTPGMARAFGVVHADGTPDLSRSRGITASSRQNVGVYCISLARGINPASTTIVASPNEADAGSTSKAIAQVDTSGADCGAGRLEVEIRRVAIDTTVNPPVIVDHHTDNGFTFVVP